MSDVLSAIGWCVGWFILWVAIAIVFISFLNVINAIADKNSKRAEMYAAAARLINKLADSTSANPRSVIKAFKGKGDDEDGSEAGSQ